MEFKTMRPATLIPNYPATVDGSGGIKSIECPRLVALSWTIGISRSKAVAFFLHSMVG